MANKNRLTQGEETVTAQTTPKTAQIRFSPGEVPTLEQCQQQVREYAYELWEAAGHPEGDGSNFWIEAEKQLFGGMTLGGYRIYVGEDIERNPSPQAFILTATGLLDEDKAAAESDGQKKTDEAPARNVSSKKTPVTA